MINQLQTEPAAVIGLVVAALTAVVAGVAVVASGGTVLVGVLAALNSAVVSLGGASVVRQKVTPVSERRPDARDRQV